MSFDIDFAEEAFEQKLAFRNLTFSHLVCYLHFIILTLFLINHEAIGAFPNNYDPLDSIMVAKWLGASLIMIIIWIVYSFFVVDHADDKPDTEKNKIQLKYGLVFILFHLLITHIALVICGSFSNIAHFCFFSLNLTTIYFYSKHIKDNMKFLNRKLFDGLHSKVFYIQMQVIIFGQIASFFALCQKELTYDELVTEFLQTCLDIFVKMYLFVLYSPVVADFVLVCKDGLQKSVGSEPVPMTPEEEQADYLGWEEAIKKSGMIKWVIF